MKHLNLILFSLLFTNVVYANGLTTTVQANPVDDVVSFGLKRSDPNHLYFVDEGYRQGMIEPNSVLGFVTTTIPSTVQLGPLDVVFQIRGAKAVLDQIDDDDFGEFALALLEAGHGPYAKKEDSIPSLVAKILRSIIPWTDAHASGPGFWSNLWRRASKWVKGFRRVRPEVATVVRHKNRYPSLTIRRGSINDRQLQQTVQEVFFETVEIAGEKVGISGSKSVSTNPNGVEIIIEITDIVPGQ